MVAVISFAVVASIRTLFAGDGTTTTTSAAEPPDTTAATTSEMFAGPPEPEERTDSIEILAELLLRYRAGGDDVVLPVTFQTPPPLYSGDRTRITLFFRDSGELACDGDRDAGAFEWGLDGLGRIEGSGCSVMYRAPANIDTETVEVIYGAYNGEYNAEPDLWITLRPIQDRARIFLLDSSARMAAIASETGEKPLTVFDEAVEAIEEQHSKTPEDRATAVWVFGGDSSNAECEDLVDNPLSYLDWAANQQAITNGALDELVVSDSAQAPLVSALLDILGALPPAVKGDSGEASIVVVTGGGTNCPGEDVFEAFPLLGSLEEDGIVVNLFLVPTTPDPDEQYQATREMLVSLAAEKPNVLTLYECAVDEPISVASIDLDAFCDGT